MSNDTKSLCNIRVITDTDKSYERIGEVDGAFQEQELKEHIKNHGVAGLFERLAFLQWQVFQALRDCNAEKGNQDAVEMNKPSS